ncbi:olfactory receptor class A-like protein 1 [Rhinatrema bivittatum]|uniref:olfactory receptor class A-like protein 1 n=1 Tax=Rhinatrema bivittatum TaxID=194408 RepID=UPI00112D4F27|nr:olfactory receptor class A-like protein 1 [Rhinatrema bivittatum]
MGLRSTLKALGFALLVAIGIPGNATILTFFLHTQLAKRKLSPTDFILSTLAFVNLLVIVSRGIPQTLSAVGIPQLFDNYACKVVIYIYRVGRAMVICVTCLLSTYQCIAVLPASERGLILKHRVSQNIWVILLTLWGLNCLLSQSTLLYSHAISNYTIPPYTVNLEFCQVVFPDYISYTSAGVVFVVRDFLFVGLMTLSSCCLVCILYRHRKQVTGIRSSDRTSRAMAEDKASRSVVLLVTLYILLFGLDNEIWIYSLSALQEASTISDARVFFTSMYSALSPIVILITNQKLRMKKLCL